MLVNEQGGAAGALKGRWVRRRYALREGYIRPVLGDTKQNYDPFASYYGKDPHRADTSLYLALAGLDLDDHKAIEEFASTWGLLGLFQHRLVQIRRTHVPPPDEDPLSSLLTAKKPSPLVDPEDYVGDFGISEGFEFPADEESAWGRTITESPLLAFTEKDDPDTIHRGLRRLTPSYIEHLTQLGYVATDADGRLSLAAGMLEVETAIRMLNRQRYTEWWEKTLYPKGSVLFRTPVGIIDEMPIAEYYGKYLDKKAVDREAIDTFFESKLFRLKSLTPDQADEPDWELYLLEEIRGRHTPHFISSFFWNALSEPLEDFKEAVVAFRQCYSACVHLSSSPRMAPIDPFDDDTPVDDERREYWRVSNQLYHLLQEELKLVTPAIDRHGFESDWTLTWRFPSLLSAAYTMLFQAYVVEKRKLCFCANETCGKPFDTDRPDRKFCSDRCQNAQKQREYRRKQKGASE